MKLRAQYDRRCSSESRRLLKLKEPRSVMQTNSNEHNTQAGNGLSLTLQPELLTRTPTAGGSSPSDTGEVRVPISVPPGESSGRSASRRPRTGSHAHSHSHSHSRPHSHSEPEPEPVDSDLESGEPSTSLSELRYLFRWVQKSLPFMAILCAKLIIQHVLGIATGLGLCMTFVYTDKSIREQVFLQDRRSKLQCVWLLTYLTFSTLLLHYTFYAETLYYCLIFVSPRVESIGFWGALWTVGVTNFIVKFLFMGMKCLILALPSAFMAYRVRGRWYMLIEEVGQVYQAIAPMPVWFRFLVTYQEVDGSAGLTLGIMLALVYLIIKLLGLYDQWGSIKKTVRIFFSDERSGAAATNSQCSEAGDMCPICQAEFREPRILLCQHIFCDECISLWFNREKTCPLCRTVITDKVHKWKDGATSRHLQIY